MRPTTVAAWTAVIPVLLVSLLVPPAGAAPAPDRTRPSAGFTTTDGTVRASATGGDLSTVRGWAKDDASGVRRVTVTYCPGSKGDDGSWTCGSTGSLGTLTTVRAAVSCRPSRRSCTWAAAVPQRPGRYLVFVRAADRAGHQRAAGPIEVYVA